MGQRVCGPAGVELLEPATAPLDAGEVDGIEVAQRLAGLQREIRVVRRTPRLVELHASRFAARIDEACNKAWATDADVPAGEVARDRRERVLLPHPLLVAGEAERREGADDDEKYSNRPHR